MAPEIMPVLDPADHALMVTPDQLKSQGSKTSNVSFLRKTQYMTSQNARANDPLIRTNPRTQKPIGRSASLVEAQLAKDDKENIKRHIQKSFDLAYPESAQSEANPAPSTAAERDAWQNPVHPDNPRLKPASYFNVLPDFDAFTDQGGYISIKFDKPPLPSRKGRRDDRADVALLRAFPDERSSAVWQAKKEAFEENPDKYEDPGPEPVVWAYEVPAFEGGTDRVRRILNDADPEKDNLVLWEGLYDPNDAEEGQEEAQPFITYNKVRSYPNSIQQDVNSSRFLALTLFNPDTAPPNSRLKSRGEAAYIYPIFQRMKVRADRGKLARTVQAANVDDKDPTADYGGTALRFKEPSLLIQQARLYEKFQRDDAFREDYERVSRLLAEEDARTTAIHPKEDVQMEGPGANGEHRVNGIVGADRETGPGGSEDDAEGEADIDADGMRDD